ncbi:MAG TPA: dihydrofolate reductase family protein [Ilumatobacteraceae bacterium]|nr:dihydrofolate reductase family protein [Ilumatobacteraceae bacterium]
MTTLTYYTATTLDGFIADPHDSLDWLLRQPHDDNGLLNYEDFIVDIGAIVMGSTTYQWVRDHYPDEWLYTMPAWVLTSRELQPPAGSDVRFASGDVHPVYDDMIAAADGKNLWVVGGGELAGRFADAGLLDEVIVSIAPVTLGAGRPILPRRLDLELLEVGRNGALVAARYKVSGPLTEDRHP